MLDAATLIAPAQTTLAQAAPASAPESEPSAVDTLLNAIITLLMPLFIAQSGDPLGARLAIIETLAAYGAQTRAELLNAAQVIAFSLSALDNLGRAMAPELSVSLCLRLRGGANALNRAARQNARALNAPTPNDDQRTNPARGSHGPAQPADPAEETDEADIQVAMEQARNRIAMAQARIDVEQATLRLASAPTPVPASAPPAAAQLSPPTLAPENGTGGRNIGGKSTDLMWASAMARVADDLTFHANSAAAAPALRKTDLLWANALGSVAGHLADTTNARPAARQAVEAALTHPPDHPRKAPKPV